MLVTIFRMFLFSLTYASLYHFHFDKTHTGPHAEHDDETHTTQKGHGGSLGETRQFRSDVLVDLAEGRAVDLWEALRTAGVVCDSIAFLRGRVEFLVLVPAKFIRLVIRKRQRRKSPND